jgi:hypothetical protein
MKTVKRPSPSDKQGWSQWVDATLGQSLLAGVYEPDFVRLRQFKQNKSPV